MAFLSLNIKECEVEEYIGHKLYDIKIEKAKEENPLGGLIDYIKNHIFASVVIGIVILVFIAIMVNICRSERRKAGTGSGSKTQLGGFPCDTL